MGRAAPRFVWDEKGLLTGVDFPGAPPRVAGATPLEPPGTGAQDKELIWSGNALQLLGHT